MNWILKCGSTVVSMVRSGSIAGSARPGRRPPLLQAASPSGRGRRVHPAAEVDLQAGAVQRRVVALDAATKEVRLSTAGSLRIMLDTCRWRSAMLAKETDWRRLGGALNAMPFILDREKAFSG